MSKKSLLLVLFAFLMSWLELKLERPKWICKYLVTCTRQYHIFFQECYNWYNSHDFLDFLISSICDKFIYFSSFLWLENIQACSVKIEPRLGEVFYGRGRVFLWCINPLSTSPTKWSNTLKQLIGKLLTNCLSVFDHFVKLAVKGLRVCHVFS